MRETTMRIAVIGAGGVGGYFGGRLAQAGNDVTFVARGRHLAAMRERGLVLESAAGNACITRATFTDEPGSVGPCDVVMFCVKLWDVESAAFRIAPLVAKGGVVIPFQNGVDAPDILQRTLGAQRVLGGIAYIAATIREPGVVAHTGTMARLVVGAFPGGDAAAAEGFRAACAAAGVQCDVSPDVRRALWEKFCMLAAMSGCTSLARAAGRRHPQRSGSARDVRGGGARGVGDRPRARASRSPTTTRRSSSRSSTACRRRCARRC